MNRPLRSDLAIVAPLLFLSFVPSIGALARLAGLLAGAAATPDTARFVNGPLPILLHVACVLPWCLVGAFQFAPALRRRWPAWHRRVGTALVALGLGTGLTGLWMTATYDVPPAMEGPLLHAVRWAVGAAMVASVALGVLRVKQRDLAGHEAWMIRAYALSQGAGMQVVLMLPLIALGHEPQWLLRDVLMTLAWALNLAFAEWLIRRAPAGLVPAAG